MHYPPLIDGKPVAEEALPTLELLNPSTGEGIGTIGMADEEQAQRAVMAAHRAFRSASWREITPESRAAILMAMANVMEENEAELVQLDVQSAGLPPSASGWGVRSAAQQFRYYAGLVDKLEGATIPVGPNAPEYTIWEPLGVTLHIMPSNSPTYLFGRSVAPALAAGNTVIVKPAEQTTPSAVRLVQLITEAGLLPSGVLNVVSGLGSVVGEALTGNPLVDEITFTGSVAVGRHVMKRAAENITPVVLELGGKSPNIIFADADMAKAIPAAVLGAFERAGQVCVARSRLLLAKEIRAEVVDALAQRARTLRLGKAIEEPEMGPLISQEHRERVQRYVDIGLNEGAQLACGGAIPEDTRLKNGFFYLPTIFDAVGSHMRIAQEEVFGPVLSVIEFEDEDQAIEIANDVPYGLYAEVWTQDIKRAHRVASQLDAGRIGINGEVVAPQIPGGGFKQSGIGIEKGLAGIRNYQRLKNVCVIL